MAVRPEKITVKAETRSAAQAISEQALSGCDASKVRPSPSAW